MAGRGTLVVRRWILMLSICGEMSGLAVEPPQQRAVPNLSGGVVHLQASVDLQDDPESLRLLRKAAEGGHAPAQLDMARRCKTGNGVPLDNVEGFEWLLKAALNGEVEAQTTLALCYSHGDGTPKDEEAAAKWYETAKKAGSSFAQESLYRMKINGRPTDAKAVATTYQDEAKGGNVPAQIGFAACLEEGRGVSKDLAAAAKWYLAAARQNDSFAKYRAGLLLQDVEATRLQAYELLAVAGSDGIAAARKAADALQSKIPADAYAKVDALVNERKKPVALAPGENRPAANNMPPGLPAVRNLLRLPIGSGTGFFITEDGYLVTNFHVIKPGRRFEVEQNKVKYPATVVLSDMAHDLAILKVDGKFSALEIIPDKDVGLGDDVLTVGFPRPLVQGVSPKLSRGEISSVLGLRDDPTEFQVSLPLQPGNSGGAMVNKDGKVIGIVRATLNTDESGSPSQNVNYAVKSGFLLELISRDPQVKGKLFKMRPNGGGANMAPPVKQTEAAAGIIWVYD